MKPNWKLVPVAGALALFSCAHAPPPASAQPAPAAPAASVQASAPEEVPALKLGTDVRPTHYAIRLTVDPTRDGFTGTEEVEATLEKARSTLWINGRDLDVTEAWVEAGGKRQAATYHQVTPAGVAKVDLPAQVGPGKVTLHFAWSTRFDTHAVGLYKTTEANVAYAVTQFEATDARRAFPSFDQPEFKTPFDLTLTVPSADVAIANTLETATHPAPNGMKEVAFGTTRPLPTYLLALAVGPFDVVQGPTLPPNEFRSYPVPTRAVGPKGRGQELAWALESGAQIVAAEEQYFRIAYPYPKLDQLALPDFAAGAMENAGAITYREQLLLFRPGVSSPSDKFEIASVEAHEIAHQWFGDLVTMPFWTDAWLNEAFATWMANRTLQTWNPHLGPNRGELLREIHRAMSADALPSARAIRQPLTRIEDVWNQFDDLTYQKGASVIGMFERWGGEEKFRAGITRYLTSHAWGSGSTDDFLADISSATGRDVAAPFHSFLDQGGIPTLAVKPVCDAQGARLEVSQKRFSPLGVKTPEGQTWGIPLCVRYQSGGAAQETCELITRPTQTVALKGCPDWVFPNADASGYYHWSLEKPWLAKLEGKRLHALTQPEKLDLTENLAAQVKSGGVQYADALEALAPLAREADPGLVRPIIELVSFGRDQLVPASEQARVDAYGRALFLPVWNKLGWKAAAGESTEASMVRSDLLAFLALKVNASPVAAQALKKGMAYVALDGKTFDTRAVPPELTDAVLEAAVQGSPAVFDGLLTRLPTLVDAKQRAQVLRAFAFTRDPQRLQRALALSTDAALRSNERALTVFYSGIRPQTREQAWAFVQKSFDAFAPGIPPPYVAYIPTVFATFCDPAHAQQLEAFFQPKLAKTEGMAIPLAQAVNQIQSCAAVKAAQSESATRFFAAKH